MKNTIKLLKQEFVSSSTTTPQFQEFYLTFCKDMKRLIKKHNGELISINKGHFYVSGFFRIKEQMWYFSLGDVRWSPSILIRTAKHEKDYTGGSNNFISLRDIDENIFNQMFNLLIKS